jgi:hypothetical protein
VTKQILLAASGLTAAMAMQLSADQVVLDYSIAYSGPNPAAAAPWLRATLTDTTYNSANSVFLRIEGIGLSGTEFASTWAFNLVSSIDPGSVSFTEVARANYNGSSTPQAGSQNGVNAGGGFKLDFDLNLPTSQANRFGAGSMLTYRLDRTGGINIYDLLVTATSGGSGSAVSVAHIQALDGGNSVWVSAGDSFTATPVPEPSTYAAGVAMAAIGAWTVRRHLKKNA